jgi:hypothetical protein
MGPIIGAVVLFIVAALLYFQSHAAGAAKETFDNPQLPTPVAGRPYVAGPGDGTDKDVPADLNRAPTTIPTASRAVPTSQQRPTTIPGAQFAPREAMAQRKDLYDLDNKISTWLAAAALYESEHPGGLTGEQLQRRIILQGRLVAVRDQLGTGLMTDTYKQVAAEIAELRQEITGWGAPAPALDAVDSFAKTLAEDAFLTAGQYREFRRLFDAILNQYTGFTQPNPLERVRTQQLQMFQHELMRAEREVNPPPIRAGAARLFLKQSLKPDQPLPTLFSIAPSPAPSLAADPRDVIGQLKDLKWRLTVTYNPAEAELNRAIAALLNRMEADDVRPEEVENARRTVVEMMDVTAPRPLNDVTEPSPLRYYDPHDLRTRANTLCQQIREAFSPEDAIALGCPATTITTIADAETAINIVCDRLRYSVPNRSTAQFNCPATNV